MRRAALRFPENRESGVKCSFCVYISEMVCLLHDHPIRTYTVLPTGLGKVRRANRVFALMEVRGFTRPRSVERCSRNLLETGGRPKVACIFRDRWAARRCNLFLTAARLAFSIECVPQSGIPQSHAEWLRVSGPLKPRQPDRVHLPGHMVPSPAR